MKDVWNEDDLPQIDLTPLIDCLFMLILFFVLTMSFSKPVLDIVLPQVAEPSESTTRDEVMLSVKADGSYWLDAREVTLDELTTTLVAQPNKMLNIYMDERAPFSRFVAVLEVAKRERNGQFVISTDKATSATTTTTTTATSSVAPLSQGG